MPGVQVRLRKEPAALPASGIREARGRVVRGHLWTSLCGEMAIRFPGVMVKASGVLHCRCHKTFNEEEVNVIAKHQLDAADHSNSVVTEPPLTHVEGESMLYFARPLENKETESTVAAIQDMINEINCMYKTKAVFRLHSDRAQELCGERVRDHFRPHGV